jgi:two-component sensor histidine kinase
MMARRAAIGDHYTYGSAKAAWRVAMMISTIERDPQSAIVSVLPPSKPGPEFSAADEIHHRVANSLQLLSAIVFAEARDIQDPAAAAALDMTLRRIAAIAGVHRQLYRSGRAATVNLGTYLDELGGALEESVADTAAGRFVMVHAAGVVVPAEEATAIGIIVSEIVTNAFKHAYVPGASGIVSIALRAGAAGGYLLEVKDRGAGHQADSIARGSGLGGRLVGMMATKLGGHYAWLNARPGTCFELCVGKR